MRRVQKVNYSRVVGLKEEQMDSSVNVRYLFSDVS